MISATPIFPEDAADAGPPDAVDEPDDPDWALASGAAAEFALDELAAGVWLLPHAEMTNEAAAIIEIPMISGRYERSAPLRECIVELLTR